MDLFATPGLPAELEIFAAAAIVDWIASGRLGPCERCDRVLFRAGVARALGTPGYAGGLASICGRKATA